jgi:hypothetical protein
MSSETQLAPTTRRTNSAHWTPQNRDRMSEVISALWQDAEYREEMSRRMKAGWALRRKRLAEGAIR